MFDAELLGLRSARILTVQEFTTIGECIHMMINRGVSSVLVMGQHHKDEVIGILTERDILKHFHKLKELQSEHLPVWKFMTRGVISLPLNKLDEAADLMFEKNIRHLVITAEDQNKKPKLAGVISMRDLFKQQIKSQKKKAKQSATIVLNNILLVANLDLPRQFFRSLLSQFKDVNFQITESNDPKLNEKCLDVDAVIIDIDQMASSIWIDLLRFILLSKKQPKSIVFLFEASLHDKKNITALAKISQSRSIHILEKPFSIVDAIEVLQ